MLRIKLSSNCSDLQHWTKRSLKDFCRTSRQDEGEGRGRGRGRGNEREGGGGGEVRGRGYLNTV